MSTLFNKSVVYTIFSIQLLKEIWPLKLYTFHFVQLLELHSEAYFIEDYFSCPLNWKVFKNAL